MKKFFKVVKMLLSKQCAVITTDDFVITSSGKPQDFARLLLGGIDALTMEYNEIVSNLNTLCYTVGRQTKTASRFDTFSPAEPVKPVLPEQTPSVVPVNKKPAVLKPSVKPAAKKTVKPAFKRPAESLQKEDSHEAV